MTTQPPPPSSGPLPCWADLQIVGHVRHLCYLSEVQFLGISWLKVEPVNPLDGSPGKTHYYRPEMVYDLEPTTEDEIRAEIAERQRYSARRSSAFAAPLLEEEMPFDTGIEEGIEQQQERDIHEDLTTQTQFTHYGPSTDPPVVPNIWDEETTHGILHDDR
jgi:hypothetical protein